MGRNIQNNSRGNSVDFAGDVDMLQSRRCPNCGSADIDENLNCIFCGSRLEEDQDGNVILSALVNVCDKCKTPVSREDEFCPKCGNNLSFQCPVCNEQHPNGTEFCTKTGKDLQVFKFFKAIRTGIQKTMVVMLEENKNLIACRSQEDGATALHIAVASNRAHLAGLLMRNYGAEVNATDKFGCTPLYIAIQKGNKEMVRLLIESNARIDSTCTDSNLVRGSNCSFSNVTPLHCAVASGNLQIVKMLLEAGASPKATAIRSDSQVPVTPRDIARLNQNINIDEFLRQHEEDLSGMHPRLKQRVYRRYAALLAFFMGGFGLHRFYLGLKWRWLYLLTFWTCLPMIAGIIEGFIITFTSKEKFVNYYNRLLPANAKDRWSIGPIGPLFVIPGIVFCWYYLVFCVWLPSLEPKTQPYSAYLENHQETRLRINETVRGVDVRSPENTYIAYTELTTTGTANAGGENTGGPDVKVCKIVVCDEIYRKEIWSISSDTDPKASGQAVVYKIIDWSYGSKYLLFAAGPPPGKTGQITLYRYTRETGAVETITFTPPAGNSNPADIDLIAGGGWLETLPVVRIRDSAAKGETSYWVWNIDRKTIEKTVESPPADYREYGMVKEGENEKVVQPESTASPTVSPTAVSASPDATVVPKPEGSPGASPAGAAPSPESSKEKGGEVFMETD